MNLESKLIPRTWKEVPNRFHERLGDNYGRQRAMFEEEHLLLILHEVPEPGVPEREGLLFWRAPDGVWKTSGPGTGLPALKEFLTRYSERINQLEDDLSEATRAKQFFEILKSANPIRRASRHVSETLQAARDYIIHDRIIISLRDEAQEIGRAAELLLDDAKNGLDFDLAQTAEEQAKAGHELANAGHRLNLLAALFLPLTAIASVFGMNLPHGLEEVKTPLVFWGTLVFGLGFGFLLKSSLNKKEGTDS